MKIQKTALDHFEKFFEISKKENKEYGDYDFVTRDRHEQRVFEIRNWDKSCAIAFNIKTGRMERKNSEGDY